jgi:hypothetical protein
VSPAALRSSAVIAVGLGNVDRLQADAERWSMPRRIGVALAAASEPDEEITARGLLRRVLAKVTLAAALPVEEKPPCAAVFEDERVVLSQDRLARESRIIWYRSVTSHVDLICPAWNLRTL